MYGVLVLADAIEVMEEVDQSYYEMVVAYKDNEPLLINTNAILDTSTQKIAEPNEKTIEDHEEHEMVMVVVAQAKIEVDDVPDA